MKHKGNHILNIVKVVTIIMKTEKNIYHKIYKLENLIYAYNRAKRSKRYKFQVREFETDRELNILYIAHILENELYSPGEYHIFKVYEPKERLIMALPFLDRIVQHAIVNVIESIFNKRFITHSYACIQNKGVHEASNILSTWLYNTCVKQSKKMYAIKGDIKHYFQNVDHEILKYEIKRYISDKKILNILDVIIEHNGVYPDGVGIPVGNLTSQLFANIYLNILDQYVKHELHVKYYIRYMDDFIILDNDLSKLKFILDSIKSFCGKNLKLQLNAKSTILSAKNGIDFIGYRHWAEKKIVRKKAKRGVVKLLKNFERGETPIEEFKMSFTSRMASIRHADSYNLRKKYYKRANELISAYRKYK